MNRIMIINPAYPCLPAGKERKVLETNFVLSSFFLASWRLSGEIFLFSWRSWRPFDEVYPERQRRAQDMLGVFELDFC